MPENRRKKKNASQRTQEEKPETEPEKPETYEDRVAGGLMPTEEPEE